MPESQFHLEVGVFHSVVRSHPELHRCDDKLVCKFYIACLVEVILRHFATEVTNQLRIFRELGIIVPIYVVRCHADLDPSYHHHSMLVEILRHHTGIKLLDHSPTVHWRSPHKSMPTRPFHNVWNRSVPKLVDCYPSLCNNISSTEILQPGQEVFIPSTDGNSSSSPRSPLGPLF